MKKNLGQPEPNYRSKFEKSIGEFLGSNAVHEPERIYFIQPSKQRFYIPDFKTQSGIYIECKGRWDASDRFKHVWLREQHPDKRIIIVFQDASVRLSKRSKTTYGEWATKNNIPWLDFRTKEGDCEEWLKEHVFGVNKQSQSKTSRKQRKQTL